MVAAVSLPNESEEQNIPKKEVTHHLPPGAYPVYPQFMGLCTIYLLNLNINIGSNILSMFFISHLYKNFYNIYIFKIGLLCLNITIESYTVLFSILSNNSFVIKITEKKLFLYETHILQYFFGN